MFSQHGLCFKPVLLREKKRVREINGEQAKERLLLYLVYLETTSYISILFLGWVFFFVSKGFKNLISLKYTCSYIDVNQTIYLNVVYKRMENS